MRTFLAIRCASLALCAVACAAEPSSSSTSDDNNIIGGVDAVSAKLDAVGSVIMWKADGTVAGGCTGTLIAPDLVLTAKHCALSDLTQPQSPTVIAAGGKIEFRIGSNMRAPRKIVTAADARVCGPGNGGTAGLGCDVAVLRLSETITDVTPIPASTAPLGAEMVGTKFTAMGYGTTDAASTTSGSRKMASMTLRAITGPGLHAIWPTYEDFVAMIDRAEGAGFAEQAGYYRARYDQPLLEGYEAQLGAAPGDGQVCHGDSGGPLLKNVDGKLFVYGVASTVVGGVKEVCEASGMVYATLGPAAQDLLQTAANDPCAAVPAAGSCEGDVAVRCARADEGERRVLRTDCSALLQRCEVGTAVSCVD